MIAVLNNLLMCGITTCCLIFKQHTDMFLRGRTLENQSTISAHHKLQKKLFKKWSYRANTTCNKNQGDLSCKHSDHQRNIQKSSWLLTHTAVPSMLPPNSTSTLRQYKELYKGLSANRRSRAKNWWKSGSQTPLRYIPYIHMTVAFHLWDGYNYGSSIGSILWQHRFISSNKRACFNRNVVARKARTYRAGSFDLDT